MATTWSEVLRTFFTMINYRDSVYLLYQSKELTCLQSVSKRVKKKIKKTLLGF